MPVKLFDTRQKALEVSFVQFSGGERHVQIGAFENCTQYVLRADLRTSNDVFDLLLTADALNQKFEDCELYIEIPYLPYARQDRVCAPGQAFSLKVLAGLFGQIENVKQIITWDCHSAVGTDLTGAKNVPAQDIIKANGELSAMIMDLNTVAFVLIKAPSTAHRISSMLLKKTFSLNLLSIAKRFAIPPRVKLPIRM